MDYTNSCNNVPAKTYHAKADVRLKDKQLLINGRTYQIIANEKKCLRSRFNAEKNMILF